MAPVVGGTPPPFHEASESEDPTSDEAWVGHGVGTYRRNFTKYSKFHVN